MISSWEPFALTAEGKFFTDEMHKEPASGMPASK
jgi:hypothetical protein